MARRDIVKFTDDQPQRKVYLGACYMYKTEVPAWKWNDTHTIVLPHAMPWRQP